MGAQATDGHGLGFRFSAGRPMNPFQSDAYMGQSLPSQVDLRSQDSPISDQGQLGSCTAFGIGRGLRQFDELKEDSLIAQQQPFGAFLNVNRMAAQFTELSPLWLYYEERKADGDISQDAGSTVSTGMKVVMTEGIPPEADWPYDISKFTQQPPAQSYKDAGAWKFHSDKALNNLNDIKATLASGWPVVFGFQVYQSFMNIGSDGMMPMPSPNNGDYVVGGHCVMVIGYDDARQVLIVRNSWGTSWGDNGYFYMPYAYVTPDNVSDMWTGK